MPNNEKSLEDQEADLRSALFDNAARGNEPAYPDPTAREKENSEPRPEIDGDEVQQPEAQEPPVVADKPSSDTPPVKDEPKQAPEEKPESNYTRAQKANERYDKEEAALKVKEAELAEKKRSWQELQDRKQKVAKEFAELEKAKPVDPDAEFKDDGGFSIADYLRAGETYEREGDIEKALMCTKAVMRLREQAQIKLAAAQQERQTHEINNRWQASVEEVVRERPELNDMTKPISQAVLRIVRPDTNDERGLHIAGLLQQSPMGFRFATELAQLQIDSGRVPELEKELKRLNDENAQLRQSTSLNSAATGRRTSPSNSKEVNAEDDLDTMEAKLREKAEFLNKV